MTTDNGAQLPPGAVQGFKDADAYDAHRPSYPPDVVDDFLKHLLVRDQVDSHIVEIAAGTGKFTELLAWRPERFLIKAVEPHKDMREKLAAKDLPAVEVVAGEAQKMPIKSEWGDACIIAQGFHWFATREALREIHRVLRPGAILGMIWNVEDYNKPREWEAATKWEQKLNDLVFSLDEDGSAKSGDGTTRKKELDGHPRFRHLQWKNIFEEQLPGSPYQAFKDAFMDTMPKFSLPMGEACSEKWTVWLTEDALWSRFNTLSQVAMLKGQEREIVEKTFKETLQGGDVERNENGQIALHGVTYYSWTDCL